MYIVKDEYFNTIDIIQMYTSIVWVEKYSDYGECEIEILYDKDLYLNNSLKNMYKLGNFIYKSGSDYITLITDIQYSSSIEQGDKMIIKGKTFEFILTNRILLYNPVEEYDDQDWDYFPGNDNSKPKSISEPIEIILKDNLIDPKNPSSIEWSNLDPINRKIFSVDKNNDWFLYIDESDFINKDEHGETIESDFLLKLKDIINNSDYYFKQSESQGMLSMIPASLNFNIGTTIKEFLDSVLIERGISYKFKYDDSVHKVKLIPYKGRDLTDFSKSHYVLFSRKFNNISECTYDINSENYKNVCYIHSDFYDTGSDSSYIVSKPFGSKNGIERKEIYLDVSEDDYDRIEGRDSEVILKSKAYTYLSTDCKLKKELNAEATTDDMHYIYKRDYDLGDIVLFENPFGENEKVRITAYTYTSDQNGDYEYPTFSHLSDRNI